MTVSRIPRYDMETDRRGRLLTPVRPPRYATIPVTRDSVGIVGRPAVIATPTEWVGDVRVLSDPIETGPGQWYVRWCTDATWYALQEALQSIDDLDGQTHGMVEIGRIWLIEPLSPRPDTTPSPGA